MALQLATRIHAVERETEEGGNSGETCMVQLASGGRTIAYVKVLPPRKIAVEVLCALLAKHLGLPVAAPLLVRVPGEADLRFGAAFIDAPPFRRAVKLEGTAALKRIRAWKQLVPSACFDEWIANPDRHAGNLLHDGKAGFWLIDHDAALDAGHADDALCGQNLMMTLAIHGMDPSNVAATLWPQVQGTLHSYRDTPLEALTQRAASAWLESRDTLMAMLGRRQANLPMLGRKRLSPPQGDIFDGPAT